MTTGEKDRETLREAAIKLSQIMEYHEIVLDAVEGTDSVEDLTEEDLKVVIEKHTVMLAEIRMMVARLVMVSGHLAGRGPTQELLYVASVVAPEDPDCPIIIAGL